MWNYARAVNFQQAEIHFNQCITACGITHEKVNFQQAEIHFNQCITACGIMQEIVNFPRSGNTLWLVYIRMRNHARNSEFPEKRKYTRMGETPHVELRQNKWIFKEVEIHLK